MNTPNELSFFCPAKIFAGMESLAQLPVELDALGARKPLLLSAAGRTPGGVIKSVIAAFASFDAALGVIDRVPERLTWDDISHMSAVYRNHDCDAVVAVGSGAAADAAKWINLVTATPPDCLDECIEHPERIGPLGPSANIFSGVGNGCELTGYLAMEDRTLDSRHLMPDLVMIDPQVVKSADDKDLLRSSVMAFCDAVEAHAAHPHHPFINTYAAAAVTSMVAFLPLDGQPLNKTGRMALAAAQASAACAMANTGIGPARALGMSAARVLDVSPEQVSALSLVAVCGYLASENDGSYGELLRWLQGTDVYAESGSDERSEKAMTAVKQMIARMDALNLWRSTLPTDVPEETIRSIVDDACSIASQPIPVSAVSSIFDDGPARSVR